jgi:hypothetical protein
LPTNLKGVAQAFFEMLSIDQHRCIGSRAIRLRKARTSSELEDWRLEEAKTCPKLKKLKAWEDRTKSIFLKDSHQQHDRKLNK